MGSIHQSIRDITPAEHAQVTQREQHGQSLWCRLFGQRHDTSLRVMEFDLHFDRIIRHPVPDFREAITLYTLIVSPSVHIGFEPCFMDFGVVNGLFPTDHLRVAFAVRPEGNGWKALAWPFAFDWSGQIMPAEENPKIPEPDSLSMIYILSEMQAAHEAFVS